MTVIEAYFNLTSARIVLDEELVQSHPTASDTDHDGGAEDTHKSKLLRFTKLKIGKGDTVNISDSNLFVFFNHSLCICPLRPGRP